MEEATRAEGCFIDLTRGEAKLAWGNCEHW